MEKLTKQMVIDDVMAIIKPKPTKTNRGAALVQAMLARAKAERPPTPQVTTPPGITPTTGSQPIG